MANNIEAPRGPITAEEFKPIGKRLAGRLKSAFDKADLNFVGGGFDGQKVKARHFDGHLPTIPVFADPVDEVRFNNLFPKVVEGMVLVGGPTLRAEGYIDGIGGEDFQNLPDIASRMLHDQSHVVIRIVYGATSEMPLRGLSYILPGLVYMEGMKRAGIKPPQLQVAFANNISSGLNHLSSESVADEARVFSALARDYIDEFFPELADSTVFIEDTPLTKGSELRTELLALSQVVREVSSPEVIDSLIGKAQNHDARRMYAFYGAAHLLMHDVSIPGSVVPILPGQPDVQADPEAIISIGNRQESLFYRLRQEIKPHVSARYRETKTLQFFTKHHVPPYYMARGEDISLADVLNGSTNVVFQEVAATARHDLDYLKKVSDRRGDLREFLERHRT